jgi:hypothetical protein
MPTADEEFLDRAIDNAIDSLSEKGVVDSSPEPERASPVDDAEESALETEHVEKTRGKARDESGKFTKSKPEALETEGEPEQTSDQAADVESNEAPAQEEAPSQGNEAPIEPPVFWSADRKQLFAKADPELRRAIVDYEAQRNEYVNRIAADASVGKQFRERLYSDMESPDQVQAHKAELRVQGVKDEIEELHRYRAWDRIIKTDPLLHCAAILKRNNYTPYDLLQDQGSQQPEAPPTDPRVEQALAAAEEARNELRAQKQAAAQSYLQEFANGKDSRGNVRSTYFEMYRPQIVQAMSEIRNVAPHLSEGDALNHAYEFVVGEVSKLHGIQSTTQAHAKPTETKIAEAKKAKAAASSVSGAPATGVPTPRPRLKGKNFDEKLDNALDLAMDQLSAQR